MSINEAKKAAYQTAKQHGVTIDYQVGDQRWTVNVEAPDGKVFLGGEHSLVTSWLTKPDARFWMDVKQDIESNAPYMVAEE